MLNINIQKYYKIFTLTTLILGVIYFALYVNSKTYKELIIAILQQNIGFHLIFFLAKDFFINRLIVNTKNKLYKVSSIILSWIMICGSIFLFLIMIISLKAVDTKYYDSYFIIIPSLLGVFLAGSYSLIELNKK